MFAYSIIIGAVLFLGMIAILSTFTLNQIASFGNEANPIAPKANETENKLNLVSNIIENRIEKAASILENTSKLPDKREPLLLNLFSPVTK